MRLVGLIQQARRHAHAPAVVASRTALAASMRAPRRAERSEAERVEVDA
jgi:hypothetical protein